MDKYPGERRLLKIAPNPNQSDLPSQSEGSSNGYRRIAPNNVYVPPVYSIPIITQVRCIVKSCTKSYDDNSRLSTHIKAKHSLPTDEKVVCYCFKCNIEEVRNPLDFYQNHFKRHSKRPPSVRFTRKKKTNSIESVKSNEQSSKNTDQNNKDTLFAEGVESTAFEDNTSNFKDTTLMESLDNVDESSQVFAESNSHSISRLNSTIIDSEDPFNFMGNIPSAEDF